MRLLVHDQINVSAIQADALRPKQEVEVDDALGEQLLKKHPAVFTRLDAPAAPARPRKKAAAKPANKAAPTPKNKAS